MIHIGEKAPRFRVPAMIEGRFSYVDSSQFNGRWAVLCFVPHLGQIEASSLDRQTDSPHFAGGAALLAVSSNEEVLLQACISYFGNLRVILLADLLHRLHRAYRVMTTTSAARCRSFVIDPHGLLRFQLGHDLNGRGIRVLSEMLDAVQSQPPACRLRTLATPEEE